MEKQSVPAASLLAVLSLALVGAVSTPAQAQTYTLTTIASFSGSSGQGPVSQLIKDSSGNLYGTTDYGGNLSLGGGNGDGTVFKIAAGTSTLTTIASFNGTNGSNPTAGLTLDSNGNLFGVTYSGGTANHGTFYEIAAGTSTINALASFTATTGIEPSASLTIDASNNLYGTTQYGGTSGDGTVFKIAAGSSVISPIASFAGTNGSTPQYAGVTRDSSGNLFGTTGTGGTNNDGTVWEIASGSSTITTLVSFTATNGSYPDGGLVMDSSGNLYGTTSQGGASGYGTVFKVAAGTHTLSTLASFTNANGNGPYGNLLLDSSGNLFGTTYQGGAYSSGTVYEIAAGSGTIATLASFNSTNGANPLAGLLLDSTTGSLYGTTYSGGAGGGGTVFKLTPGTGGAAAPEPAALPLMLVAACWPLGKCVRGRRASSKP